MLMLLDRRGRAFCNSSPITARVPAIKQYSSNAKPSATKATARRISEIMRSEETGGRVQRRNWNSIRISATTIISLPVGFGLERKSHRTKREKFRLFHFDGDSPTRLETCTARERGPMSRPLRLIIFLFTAVFCIGASKAEESLNVRAESTSTDEAGLPNLASPDLILDSPLAPIASLDGPVETGPGLSFDPPTAAEPVVEVNEVKQKSRWRTHVRVQGGATYDDNVFIQNRDEEEDIHFNLRPEIWSGLGDVRSQLPSLTGHPSRFLKQADGLDQRALFFARYAPTATKFLDHEEEDSLTHDAGIFGRLPFDRTVVKFEGRFQTLSSPDADIGTRSDRSLASGFMEASYTVSEKTSADFRVAGSHSNYDKGFDSTDASASAFINHRVLPKTTLGLGGAVGHVWVENGENQIYEQALLHGRYHFSKKVAFDGTGGVEFRQVDGGQNAVNPVFKVGAEYAPQESTLISLYGSRRIESSASLEGTNIERTSFDLNLRQCVWRRIWLTFSAGYQRGDYAEAGGTTDFSRTDDYFTTGGAAALDVTSWLNLRLSYSYERNTSSRENFSFCRNIADLQLSVSF
jgi:hypothetical protein